MIKNPSHIIILFLISISFLQINAQDRTDDLIFKTDEYLFPYDLTSPDNKTKLPSKLREISGIRHLGDGIIAGVEDERGIVYLINFKTGEIEEEIKFGDRGDYEGLAIVGNNAWILKSNGTLYEVRKYAKGEKERNTHKYETPLSKANDTEGLAYDKANNRLLIACKGHPYTEDLDGKHTKAIYAFDLDSKELVNEPIILIDLKKIQDLKDYNWFSSIGISIMSRVDENKGDVSFQPSDIAVHPLTGNYYVTGAVGDLLLVFSPDGTLLCAAGLPDNLFKQPEGISFDNDGDMYISNEGGDGKANILKFKNH